MNETPDCPAFLPDRDFVGYGLDTPTDCWPNGAKIAVNFVINFEEGGESTLANGDEYSEGYLHEAFHKSPLKGRRDQQLETMFEYGVRQGLPRILRLFDKYGYKFTTYAVARALELAPQYAKLLPELGHEIASHGNRWRSFADMPPEEEAKHVAEAIDRLQRLTGDEIVPGGWFLGRGSNQSKRIIAREHHKRSLPLLYSSDSYADDLPYWVESPLASEGVSDGGLLIVPYSLDCNDHRFLCQGSGWSTSNDFLWHMKETFDYLYQEGIEGRPKMMTIGLHNRIIGRPGRFRCLQKYV
ncbi:glycoside hydrolase/deacetylase [Dendrothele bispora CBS 962.96]|uniref:Glycoside hydrolase/deacetylase n=1 Tax=Dendrothele bispora (strain CBS 962.96) TaxID=1314807 RepID=A0A4S8MKA0_DENBC|nr:glycoside hydrolase/deacetylase [Dendrothele bispora CBS 962.96]